MLKMESNSCFTVYFFTIQFARIMYGVTHVLNEYHPATRYAYEMAYGIAMMLICIPAGSQLQQKSMALAEMSACFPLFVGAVIDMETEMAYVYAINGLISCGFTFFLPDLIETGEEIPVAEYVGMVDDSDV